MPLGTLCHLTRTRILLCLLTLCLVSRVRSARGEVEGKLPEGGEYGAGTWRRSRIMEVEGRSGSQDGAHTAPYWPNGTALCALQCGHSATFAVVTEPKTCPQL